MENGEQEPRLELPDNVVELAAFRRERPELKPVGHYTEALGRLSLMQLTAMEVLYQERYDKYRSLFERASADLTEFQTYLDSRLPDGDDPA